ncbi:DUF4145 domain-containing protein [Laspinema sp. D1]|uniref:DUF4145 domain-containing protein n=1 Tax=Laspinema palackyanum D2a TaxID=2953684 RepID=A0ABT2MY97_9CYAN|nr:DUF4145 domain-containing protein [Laspinema sp. D2a]
MTLPSRIFNKYLTQFNEIIDEGNELFNKIKDIKEPSRIAVNTSIILTEEEKNLLYDQITQWEIHYFSLIDIILPLKSTHRSFIDKKDSEKLSGQKTRLRTHLARLKGIKEVYIKGMFSDLSLEIEAEIAADYMGQAEQLLTEGQKGAYDHVPAAVLAGAVLEKGLRALCLKQEPPLSVVNANNNKPLMMNGLIDVLKSAGAFNELKAKQLRAWADIRNDAAHGNFDKFQKDDVETMIKAINHFLADYLP